MGSRGPKAKSAELRLLHNSNPGRRRVPAWPLAAALPRCPNRLQGHARALWNSLGKALVDEGLMAPMFKSTFELLCCAWGRLLDFEDELKSLPLGSKDRVVLRRMCIQQSKLVAQLSGEFGLSPCMRARVQGERTPPLKPSDWDQFK